METLSALKKMLKNKREEKSLLWKSVSLDPLVVKTKKAYDDAVKLAESKSIDKTKEIEDRIVEFEKKIDSLKQGKEKEIPEEAKEFIKNIRRGVDWGPKGIVFQWLSPNKRFIIITNPGHTSWRGRGDVAYYSSDHYLCDITKTKNSHGYDTFSNSKVFSFEGRLNKETLNKWQDYACKEETK